MRIESEIENNLDEYIRHHYHADEPWNPVPETGVSGLRSDGIAKSSKDLSESQISDLDDLLGNVGESFHTMLFRFIDEKGLSDVEVYRRAGMDRKLFSKIRSNPSYHPRKNTVLVLAIALALTQDETDTFLASAEYALSDANRGDLIIRYFLSHGVYDLEKLNNALAAYGQPILQ